MQATLTFRMTGPLVAAALLAFPVPTGVEPFQRAVDLVQPVGEADRQASISPRSAVT